MSRPSFASLASAAALACTVALSVTACSSGDVKVGTNDSALKRKDGAPTGNGTTCSWDDTVAYDVATGKTTTTPADVPDAYKVGDTFPSLDGCNSCSCTASGIVCTDAACGGGSNPSPGGGGVCKYMGYSWNPGDAVPSLDNCNHFGCQPDGSLVQTEMACQYTCPAEKFVDCMPQVPAERFAQCYGPYHDFLAANCGVVFGL